MLIKLLTFYWTILWTLTLLWELKQYHNKSIVIFQFNVWQSEEEDQKNNTRVPNPPCPWTCELTNDAGYVVYSALGSFYIPMFVMLFFYWRIYKAAVRTTKAINQGFRTTKGNVCNIIIIKYIIGIDPITFSWISLVEHFLRILSLIYLYYVQYS